MVDFGRISINTKEKYSNDDQMLNQKSDMESFEERQKALIQMKANNKPAAVMKSFTLGIRHQPDPRENDEEQRKMQEKMRKKLRKFTNIVLKSIEEIMSDIENVYDEITAQAGDHFNPKDIILTYGKSDILCSFLTHAYYGGEEGERKPGAKDFEVLICETAPLFAGHQTAK